MTKPETAEQEDFFFFPNLRPRGRRGRAQHRQLEQEKESMMHQLQGNSLSPVAFKVHKTTRFQHLLAWATAFLIPKLLAATIFQLDTSRLYCNRDTTLTEE